MLCKAAMQLLYFLKESCSNTVCSAMDLLNVLTLQ